jgi:hypothetical protein
MKVVSRHRGEGLVRSLQYALKTNVLPRSSREGEKQAGRRKAGS